MRDTIDEQFARYREIGERNLVVLRLLENWCAHAKVVRESGGGLFEEMTKLPTSMCRVTCKHERVPGSISMHLEENALNFYDRNCIDCTERQPVALPNLSELVGQRDSGRADAARRPEEEEQEAREALELRQAQRQGAFPTPTPAQESLLKLLHRLDVEASAEAAEELVAGVLAVSDELNDGYLKAIISVVTLGGMHRTAGGLLALEGSNIPRERLIHLALESMKGQELAGAVVDLTARHMEHADLHDLRLAMPALVWACRRSHFARPGEASGHTNALVSAHRAYPQVVEDSIRKALSQDSTVWRQAACAAATALLDENRQVEVESLCESLLASFRLPETDDDEGPSTRIVAGLLARLLSHYPRRAMPRVDLHEADEHEQVKMGVFLAYCSVLDRRRFVRGEDEGEAETRWEASSIQAQVLSRLLAVTTGLPNDDRLREAVEVLRRDDAWVGRFADPSIYVQTMLGTAAMACSRLESISQPSAVIVDPRPAAMQQLDQGSDSIALSSLAYELVRVVARISTGHIDPEVRHKSGRLYLETLTAIPPMADRFRSHLVRHLGLLYRGREWRNAVLPEIYSALAHPSVAVRSASNKAYEDVCRVVGPEALPSLLHESFLVHLQDPYVAVHKGAVAALKYSQVPDSFAEHVLGLLARIVDVYSDESEALHEDFFLADVLSVVVNLVRRSENAQGLGYVVRVAHGLRPDAIYSLLRGSARHLRNRRGIASLLLRIPYRPSIFGDYESEFLLKELALLPRTEIARAATRIVEVGVEAGEASLHSVIPLVRILDANGESAAARRMISTVLANAGTDRVNLRERLTLSLYLNALEIEHAAGNREMDRVEELASNIRVTERELAEDEKLNRERRQRDAFS